MFVSSKEQYNGSMQRGTTTYCNNNVCSNDVIVDIKFLMCSFAFRFDGKSCSIGGEYGNSYQNIDILYLDHI